TLRGDVIRSECHRRDSSRAAIRPESEGGDADGGLGAQVSQYGCVSKLGAAPAAMSRPAPHPADLSRRRRAAEQIALALVAVVLSEEIHLVGMLDSLGDDGQPER